MSTTFNGVTGDRQEHFCTMFDSQFLVHGLALHASLHRHCPHAVLWVVCLDRQTQDALDTLRLPSLRTIPLSELETPELRALRRDRTDREYYWTLTPHLFDAVFNRAPAASRVTYLDADLYFFQSPTALLDRMTSEHNALLTHHAYAPQYDQSATSGPFCVQFVSVRRTPQGRAAAQWWRDRCNEWCYARFEDGRFGDQRYLEEWPRMLGDSLLVINNPEWTGAPWNACLADDRAGEAWRPVFFHFHGCRHLSDDRVLLFPLNPWTYKLGPKAHRLYEAYIEAIRRSNRALRGAGISVRGMDTPPGLEDFDPWPTVLRRFGRLVKRRLQPASRRPIVSIR